MNRKGQVDPYTIGGIALVIFLLVILGPIFSNIINSATCQNEKQEIESLKGQLSSCQNTGQETTGLLESCQGELEKAKQKIEQLQNDLANANKELETCRNSREKLPIFGLTEVYLTTGWVWVINISFGLSIISIFNILKWLFWPKKKKKS